MIPATLTTVVDGLDHPECVAWGPDGYLYAGGEAGQIYRIDTAMGTTTEIASTGGFVLGIALDAEANVYACDSSHQAVMRITPSGDVSRYAAGTAERQIRTPNFPVFDRDGNLYVSDSGSWPDGGGCIFRVDTAGESTVWLTEVELFANGLALTPDERSLYAVESVRPGIVRIPIAPDGSALPPDPIIELPDTVPDGIAFDQVGRLYVACYRPDRIYRLDRDGALHVVAEDVLGTAIAAPTNVAFGGVDLSTLFIASLGRWHIGSMPVSVPGAALHYPSLSRNRPNGN